MTLLSYSALSWQTDDATPHVPIVNVMHPTLTWREERTTIYTNSWARVERICLVLPVLPKKFYSLSLVPSSAFSQFRFLRYDKFCSCKSIILFPSTFRWKRVKKLEDRRYNGSNTCQLSMLCSTPPSPGEKKEDNIYKQLSVRNHFSFLWVLLSSCMQLSHFLQFLICIHVYT